MTSTPSRMRHSTTHSAPFISRPISAWGNVVGVADVFMAGGSRKLKSYFASRASLGFYLSGGQNRSHSLNRPRSLKNTLCFMAIGLVSLCILYSLEKPPTLTLLYFFLSC